MALRRISQKLYQEKLDKASHLREYCARLNKLSQLRHSEYWVAVNEHLQLISRMADSEIKSILARKDSDQESDWAACKKLVGRIEVVETFINEVVDSTDKIEAARAQIKSLESDLEEYRERQEIEVGGDV